MTAPTAPASVREASPATNRAGAQAPDLRSRLVTALLGIKPLAAFAKSRARKMMVDRAERLGVPWRAEAAALQTRDWSADWAAVQNPALADPAAYPDYYRVSFHAYEAGNLGWEPASEVDSAARTVHSTLWGGLDPEGDAKLRAAYHDSIARAIAAPPRDVLDLGCSTGRSTFALQRVYPDANLTGLDLSPHFLAVARYRAEREPDGARIRWVHAPAEATGLPDESFDLVSACLVYHELPQSAAIAILREARRLLRPGGCVAIMDMNPQSEVYAAMPSFVLTLLKSTEPYLDQYFSLDLAQAMAEAGFEPPAVARTTPRHRSLVARKPA